MLSRYPYNPSPYDDDWEDQPAQGPIYKWGLGVALPLVILCGGVFAVATRHAAFGHVPMVLHGPSAVAFGVAGISLGLFLHCHYFWGNVYDQAWFAVLGKIVAACGFIGGLAV